MRILMVALVFAMPALALTIATDTLPAGCAGMPYPATPLAATGGDGSGYTWSITAGSLPAGMTLTPNGVLSGTPPPNSMGAYPLILQVKDAAGATATKPLTLFVSECFVVRSTSLPTGQACAAYPPTVLTATGGTGTGYVWSIAAGSLPPGLSLSPAGVLSGTLSCAAATSTFTARVQDSAGNTATLPFTLTVMPALVLTPCLTFLPQPGFLCYGPSGGCPPYTCSVFAGSLPPRITVSSTCQIFGIADPPVASVFTVQVRDSCGFTAIKQLVATGAPPLTITTASLPRGLPGAPYPPTPVESTGGTGSGYSWSVTSGALPAGLTLSPRGVVSGALSSSAVSSTFTLQVRDSADNIATKPFTIAVDPAASDPPVTADSPFQVNYAANLQIGESWVTVVNTGASGAPLLGPGYGATGNLCVNLYAFTPDEQLISCCSCLVTPNGMVHLGAYASLASRAQTPGAGYLPGFNTANGTGGLILKLVSTIPPADGSCANAAAALTASTTVLGTGMAAWRTTVQNGASIMQGGPAVRYGLTESAFLPATLSPGEMASISGRCASIIGNASGYGICRGCASGAVGAAHR